jgi:hypothetical protein
MGKELHALDGHGDSEYVRAIQDFGESIPYRLQSDGLTRDLETIFLWNIFSETQKLLLIRS